MMEKGIYTEGNRLWLGLTQVLNSSINNGLLLWLTWIKKYSLELHLWAKIFLRESFN